MTTYPVLSRIPIDVWLLVFEAGNFAPYHLKQISLTCRWFRELCLPRLYSTVVITRNKPAPGSQQELWEKIATSPDGPYHLRQGSKAEKYRGLKDAGHILRHIRRLEFRHYPLSIAKQPMWWRYTPKPFQSPQVLEFLQHNWKEVFLDVAEAFPEMEALEHLKLCHLHIPSRVSQSLKDLTSLRAIELIKCTLESTDWPRVPEVRITTPHNLPIDVSSYGIIDTTLVRSLDLPVAPSDPRTNTYPNLTSLTVPIVTLERSPLLAALKSFLIATPSIQHLSILGGLYQLRRPHSHRCYQQPKLDLPPTALPNLCRLEAFCKIIDDLVPGRNITHVNLWCWGSLEERIEKSYEIFKTSKAHSRVETLALNFPIARPLNYSILADVVPSLRTLEINYGCAQNASAIIPKLTQLLPQLARLHTLILRPTTADLAPYASEETEGPKAKVRQARKFLFELVPTASPTLSTIVLSLRTRMQLVLYRMDPRPPIMRHSHSHSHSQSQSHTASAKEEKRKEKNNEHTAWEMVEIEWDQSIGNFVPDVRLYIEREQRVPGKVEKIRIWWEKQPPPNVPAA